eukprot:15479385-Alexandrium_andersonii.AAC.1
MRTSCWKPGRAPLASGRLKALDPSAQASRVSAEVVAFAASSKQRPSRPQEARNRYCKAELQG